MEKINLTNLKFISNADYLIKNFIELEPYLYTPESSSKQLSFEIKEIILEFDPAQQTPQLNYTSSKSQVLFKSNLGDIFLYDIENLWYAINKNNPWLYDDVDLEFMTKVFEAGKEHFIDFIQSIIRQSGSLHLLKKSDKQDKPHENYVFKYRIQDSNKTSFSFDLHLHHHLLNEFLTRFNNPSLNLSNFKTSGRNFNDNGNISISPLITTLPLAIPYSTIQNLRSGDVINIGNHLKNSQTVEAALFFNQSYLQGNLIDEQTFSIKNNTIFHKTTSTQKGENVSNRLEDLNLQVSFELGTCELTLNEIQNLKEGTLIKINNTHFPRAKIYLDNKVLGEAELVNIGGELGAQILWIATNESNN